jgi:hypothetical protein
MTIDPVQLANTESVRRVAARLGLAEADLEHLLDDVASVRRAYQMYIPTIDHWPKLPDMARELQSQIDYVIETKERMIALLTPKAWWRNRPKAEQSAWGIQEALSDAERFLRAEQSLLGDIGTPSKNARKRERDLLWNTLLELWTSHGGQETGNDAADFLVEASKPVLGAAAPTPASAVRWLLRRRP